MKEYMQGMKQWCENCKEVKGLHNNCPNLTNVNKLDSDFINPLTSNAPRAIELVKQIRKSLSSDDEINL